MLQWMGGSRRKVSTSRKSTYKRQKQYFEQRKRQLQQQTAGLESYSDGKGSCTLQSRSNRSLDILSLENISTFAHEHKTSCINARDNSEYNDFTSKHQNTHPSLVGLTNEGIAVDQAEINEERAPSSSISEDEKKVSVHLPDCNEDIAGNHKKLDPLKWSPMHQISVIDLLGDDGNEEENSLQAQEAHVAFSVEGLGKVEMETPVHSPKISFRCFPDCSTPPKKARRQSITAGHLDYDIYDMGSEVDINFSDSSINLPFCSRDMMNTVGSPNQEFKSFRRPSTYNWNGCDLPGVFSNDEPICNVQDSSRNIWNGCLYTSPSFLDDSIDDFGVYDMFCKNRVHQRDIGLDDDFHCRDTWKQDLNFEGWDLPRIRSSTIRTRTFDMKETSVPHPKHETAEDLPDVFSDKMWCSTLEIDNDAHHFVREGTTESLSLRSEESCSSTAVRGAATKGYGKLMHERNGKYQNK